jgi:hypothetical protein
LHREERDMTNGELSHLSALEHNKDLLRTAERERRLPRRRGLIRRRARV